MALNLTGLIDFSPFEYLPEYLDTLEIHSRRTCKSTFKYFRKFLSDALRDENSLTTRDVMDWKDELDLTQKPSTVNRKLVTLNAFFSWLSEKTGCENIVEGVPRHPNQPLKTRRAFSAVQVEAIFREVSVCRSHKDYRDRAIIHILIRTGISNGQLRKLKVRDFIRQGDISFIRATRGSKEILVPISYEVTSYIEEYLKQRRMRHDYSIDDPLFAIVKVVEPSKPNFEMSPGTVSTAVDRILKESGIREGIGEYSFPHTAIRLAMEGGASVREVEELAYLLGIPRRYILGIGKGSEAASPYEKIEDTVERMDLGRKKGAIRCSELKSALNAFEDNDLIEITIDQDGDLKLIPIMKMSRISYGLAT